jgi:hypothetical protein
MISAWPYEARILPTFLRIVSTYLVADQDDLLAFTYSTPRLAIQQSTGGGVLRREAGRGELSPILEEYELLLD